MKKLKLFVLLALAAASVSLTSCGSDDEGTIYGKWQLVRVYSTEIDSETGEITVEDITDENELKYYMGEDYNLSFAIDGTYSNLYYYDMPWSVFGNQIKLDDYSYVFNLSGNSLVLYDEFENIRGNVVKEYDYYIKVSNTAE